jgi:DNA-binding transcriptional LysR family regulator
MYCESPEAAKASVKKGVGLGILYHEIVEPEVKRGELKIVKIPELKMMMKAETFVLHHKERRLSPYAHDFLTLLHEWPQKIRPIKAVLRAG